MNFHVVDRRLAIYTQVRTCGRKEPVDDDEDKYSAQITKTIIEKYEEFYGTQFPLPKIGTTKTADSEPNNLILESWTNDFMDFFQQRCFLNSLLFRLSSSSRLQCRSNGKLGSDLIQRNCASIQSKQGHLQQQSSSKHSCSSRTSTSVVW